jgi:hypothetical protein
MLLYQRRALVALAIEDKNGELVLPNKKGVPLLQEY